MKDIVRVRPLRPYEKIKLRRLKRLRRNAVNSRNARIIMLAVGQQRNRVIAEMVGCSVQWVRQIIHRFNDDGIDGITWLPWFQVRSARVFTIDLCEHIAEIALSSPIALIRANYDRTKDVRHFLAYYDLETDRLYGRFTEHKTGKVFLSFLRWVRSRYPMTQTLHLVMDNYGTHIMATVQAWAQSHNVRIYLTPTNGSWLNRIESQFTALKKFAMKPSDYRDHEEQQAAIESYLTWRNHARELSITAWNEYREETGLAA
jgi:transposase